MTFHPSINDPLINPPKRSQKSKNKKSSYATPLFDNKANPLSRAKPVPIKVVETKIETIEEEEKVQETPW